MPTVANRPTAATLLVRHVEAYSALLVCDLEVAQARLRRDLVSTLVLCISLVLIALLACTTLVVRSWNTPDRLSTLYLLFLPFVASALTSWWNLARNRGAGQIFERTAAELRKDRRALEAVSDGGGLDNR